MSSDSRLRLITVLIFAVTLLLLSRLFFVQIVKGSVYAARADRQYQQERQEYTDRGAIYFLTRDGARVTAATMRDGYLLAIDPTQITNAEEAYQKLSAHLDFDPADFLSRAAKKDDSYEIIATELEESLATKIRALQIPGVKVEKIRWRVYPAGRLASHVIGFMAYDGNERTGRYGLEKYYNQILERDPNQNFINFLGQAFAELRGTAVGETAETEADLVLTIEPEVQLALEKELGEVVERYAPESSGGIVMDPQTGAIVAMAAWPNFDPGGRQSDIAVLNNPLVSNVYEMGSIVKALTMAAALDAGVIKPNSTFEDLGLVTISGLPIMNHDGKAHGVVTMQEVLNQSLNTGAVFAMQKLGKSKFRDYFSGYGLREKTGIDLPNESAGLLKNLDTNREVEFATASFGQGFAVTPIEITRALATLANGGRLVKPYVVQRFDRYNSKLSQEIKPAAGKQILKPETSQAISKMLTTVVDTSLAGGRAKMEHYQIAAKTGTAQMVAPEGGYYSDRYLHSFFGYFPAQEARFLTFLYVVHPQGVQYASETLTQPFMNLTKFLINYYQIPPDR